MELRQYWRVLARRGKIVRNVFVIALVLSLATTGYSLYTTAWQGSTQIDVQMQQESVRNAVVDPIQAATQNTDQVILALTAYATTPDYFKSVSAALKQKGINIPWDTLGLNLDVHTGKSHTVFINWSDSDPNLPRTIVAVAEQKLLQWLPTWQKQYLPSAPRIKADVFAAPNVQRTHFSKSLIDLGLKIVLGLIAGVVLAYLWEYLDPTMQDEADVQRWLGAPALAVIPGGRRARRTRTA